LVGGTINHALIRHNLWAALRTRLRGGPCRPLGPDSAVAKTGDAIRYPDALVSCAKFDGTARLVPGVVVVFEVLSPTSGRTDRIDKSANTTLSPRSAATSSSNTNPPP